MNITEMTDLEKHLGKKIAAVIGDVLQLVDDPAERATVLATAMTIMFRVTVEIIGEMYEEDTGKKTSIESIVLMLAKECVQFAKSKPPSSQRKRAK